MLKHQAWHYLHQVRHEDACVAFPRLADALSLVCTANALVCWGHSLLTPICVTCTILVAALTVEGQQIVSAAFLQCHNLMVGRQAQRPSTVALSAAQHCLDDAMLHGLASLTQLLALLCCCCGALWCAVNAQAVPLVCWTCCVFAACTPVLKVTALFCAGCARSSQPVRLAPSSMHNLVMRHTPCSQCAQPLHWQCSRCEPLQGQRLGCSSDLSKFVIICL